MKVAATHALAGLAKKEGVPQLVLDAYGLKELTFGPEYIIPKPLDPRVLVEESVAVAEAAIKTGVAALQPFDLNAYRIHLEKLSETIAKR
jgi:malate dehydrogenase (oxaloacetate-decarboxylating)(NADP+)